MTNRRTPDKMNRDREALLAIFPSDGHWERVPVGTNRSDVAALAREGKIETEVRREWDTQQGTSFLFGGAGVVQRRRLYARKIN